LWRLWRLVVGWLVVVDALITALAVTMAAVLLSLARDAVVTPLVFGSCMGTRAGLSVVVATTAELKGAEGNGRC
jgi:hypothetical protein